MISLTKLDGIALTERDKERQKSDFVSLSMEIVQESLKQSNKNASDLIKIAGNKEGNTNNNNSAVSMTGS